HGNWFLRRYQMDTEKLRYGNNRDRVRSIGRALDFLNEAATDSAEDIKRILKKDYRELADVIGELGEDTVDEIRNRADQVKQRSREAASYIDESAHEHPWTYMGSAALLAGVLGYMLGCRTRDY